ncbi:YheC/YheD family protein [Paenibacillus sp. P96]|uniref:YheC/YheD family protein n=1 Tax=Paenibacillus zeirhizosphaerae TaxID=2987519 RepID=A0ABT9FR21_9BACL|nr:YheC/YheD family protein [Paenibacillus sp. P96]MDP4097119.1 YheC/YheD family protein [Paenibacillus sp. P96]
MPGQADNARQQLTTLSSKWSKTKFLLKHPALRKYVPDTSLYSYESLLDMLSKHKVAYVKPVKGTSGNGVIKVVKHHNSKFTYHVGTSTRSFAAYKDMFTSLQQTKYRREHIVQKGIDLLTYKGLIFDLRIMVQKNEKKQWEVTAYIGRLAHPQKAVTNFHNGGTPMRLEALLRPFLSDDKNANYIESLKDLGYRIATEFHKSYPKFMEIGIDFGLDSSLKPWIIEVNTRPDAYIFDQLKDKTMFQRVMLLKRFNGLLSSQRIKQKKTVRRR